MGRLASKTGLLALLAAAFAGIAPAWVECVEFPWNAVPRHLWESQLVWLKGIGITHVSLPPAGESGDAIRELIRIIRRLDLEADLEGPVPDALQPQTRAHGGPLTEPLPQAVRVSVSGPAAVIEARERLASGAGALLWTDVYDTLVYEKGATTSFREGAVGFAGEERPAAAALRRSAQLSAFWGSSFAALKETPGAGVRVPESSAPDLSKRVSLASPADLAVRQFVSDAGVSLVSVVNKSGRVWTGDLRVLYPALRRAIVLPAITVPARDSLWLPVDVPLTAGPLCKDCSAFATVDHLVYATAELTSMEFENGILAMEFAAPVAGEAILQLSREPSGPVVAGGRPGVIDWDDKAGRARVKFPAGVGPGRKVRIGLAIAAPDATAFFDSARVLLIGETNHLRAQFSSDAIAQRSRLRAPATFTVGQAPSKQELSLDYQIAVPETAVPGDYAEIALEADGTQMSHARPRLLRPAGLEFPDAIDVHLAADARMRLTPAIIPVNQRTGREVTVTVLNNAPEIRTFDVELSAEGLEFSPAKEQVVIGASASRDVTFRVFAKDAAAGLHVGEARLSIEGVAAEAARMKEAMAFAVFPQTGAAAFEGNGFSLLESAKYRAVFMPGRWLEFIGKENNQSLLAAGGVVFAAGPIEVKGDALGFGAGQRTVKLEELESLAVKAKK
jgi:hypothetical protein